MSEHVKVLYSGNVVGPGDAANSCVSVQLSSSNVRLSQVEVLHSEATGMQIRAGSPSAAGLTVDGLVINDGASLYVAGGTELDVSGGSSLLGSSAVACQTSNRSPQLDGAWAGEGVTIPTPISRPNRFRASVNYTAARNFISPSTAACPTECYVKFHITNAHRELPFPASVGKTDARCAATIGRRGPQLRGPSGEIRLLTQDG